MQYSKFRTNIFQFLAHLASFFYVFSAIIQRYRANMCENIDILDIRCTDLIGWKSVMRK